MAFGFRYNHPGTLAKYLNCVKVMIDEVTMFITPDSIYFNVMDPPHISMITLNLPVETFGDKMAHEVNINFPDFWSIFKETDDDPANETITLSCDGKEATWTLRRREGMIDTTSEIIAMIRDGIGEEVPIPKIPYRNEVVVPSATLLRELSEFENLTHITIFIENGDSLVMYSQIDTLSTDVVKRNTIKCRSGESPAFRVNKNEDNSITTYTTDFLLPYVTALAELFEAIILGWSEDGVLHIKGDVAEPTLVRDLLAPNVGVTPRVEAVKKAE